MVNNPSEQVIQQAIADAKSGNKEAAKKALSQLVKKDPNNARGWYLLSQVVEKKEQAIYCLEKLLEIQPKNQQAIKRLEELRNPPQQLIDELFSDSIEKAPNELHEPIKKKTLIGDSTSTKPVKILGFGLGLFLVICVIGVGILWVVSSNSSRFTSLIQNPTERLIETAVVSKSTSPTLAPTHTTISKLVQNKRPEYLDFSVQTTTDNLEVIFSVYDSNREYMAASGIAEIIITNSKGETVYSKDHQVNVNDFGFFTRKLTGQSLEACSIKIPLSQIKKSVDANGTVSMLFSTTNGVNFNELKNDFYGLPIYSSEELISSAQQKFEKSAINLNINKKVDNYLSVTVDNIGLMTLTEYSGNKTYIRVDVTVENIGIEKIDFYFPDPVILGKSSNQFEKSYVSYDYVFEEGEDIYPGVKKTGAFFFEVDDNSTVDIKELIISTGLSDYDLESRIIGSGQALLYDKEYVFVFDLSDITLNR